jgi:hypothetical protein
MAVKNSPKNPRVSGKRSNGQVFHRDSYRELQPHFCALPLRSVGGLIEDFDRLAVVDNLQHSLF